MGSLKHRLKDRELLLKQLFFIILDILSVVFSAFFALWIRYDFVATRIETKYAEIIWETLPLDIIVTLITYAFFTLYRSVWSYASLYEMRRVFEAAITSTAIKTIYILVIRKQSLPRSYWFLYAAALIGCAILTRFSYRALRILARRSEDRKAGKKLSRVMIVGAGEAGDTLIREIMNSKHLHMTIACIIDDNKELWGLTMRGYKIVGGREVIEEAVQRYQVDEIMIALPSATRAQRAAIAGICTKTGCETKMLPGMYQLVNRELSVSRLKNVEIEDLLGREPVKIDISKINGILTDKIILVTGGGGSIGSELCRQIAAADPKQLIIVDIYENNAYDIQQELKRKFPKLDLVVLIASVRNTNRIRSIFATYRPEIVFHAAAHKHVPLMEDSPNEAIKNNVFGTLKTVQAADVYGVKRFVLISTDKAVNPTNIMGASKRICEMIVQAYNRRSKTDFVAVRFGNVLGSNGSVIPLFKKQILEGGPVTVTHPDIIRYFMTIPEAVSLVLEAGAFAKGGEIFVLDMGEPVKIDDLARNLIRLSGFVPNEDIKIVYTGLRPGEKLYEERLMAEEGLEKTENDRISVAQPIEMDDVNFFADLDDLKTAVYDETGEVREMVRNIVPTYKVLEK